MTSTITKDRTDPSTILDVDLNAEPGCEMGDDCVGEQGPAVARITYRHRCDHPESRLICSPCTIRAAELWVQPLRITCATCGDCHRCLLMIHAGLSQI